MVAKKKDQRGTRTRAYKLRETQRSGHVYGTQRQDRVHEQVEQAFRMEVAHLAPRYGGRVRGVKLA